MAVRDIIQSINDCKWNKDKVQTFMNYGLHPRGGLPAELTIMMFDLYYKSTGDSQHVGKMGCRTCIDVVFRKLQDMLTYGDNLGKPLINWEPKNKKKEV